MTPPNSQARLRPHGVTSISGGVINTTFSYDTKGNMIAGNGLAIASAPRRWWPPLPTTPSATSPSSPMSAPTAIHLPASRAPWRHLLLRRVINTTFSYDTKGNMIAGNGLTIAYTSYDKPSTITRGTTSVSFDHDPEHQRFRQVGVGGTTLYLSCGPVMVEKFWPRHPD